jgi:two-component system, OmpR family, phosphate regulon sensor histidine kinase PhoR
MNIRTQIVLTYVLLTTLVVIGLGVLLSVQFESYYKEHLGSQLETQARLVLLDLRQSSPADAGELDARIKRLSNAAGIRITLIARDGVVIEDSDVPLEKLASVENHLMRPEVQEALRTGHGTMTRRSATVNRNFLYLATRIDHPLDSGLLKPMAILRVSMHIENIDAAVGDIRMQILFAGIVIFVVIVLVSVWISRGISKPIVEISRSVQKIRAGDLGTKIAIAAPKEVSAVADAINDLVDKLNTDIVRLKKLEQVRSEFLGNVSHELRTPIFSMQGFLETLLEGAVDDPRVNRTFLAKALSQSRRLNSLLGDLIEISRIESGEMKMSFRYFVVNAFLDQVIADARPFAESRGVTISLAHMREDVQVFGDKERLKQVLMNLIENAVKYNSPDGTVTLACAPVDTQTVRISVSDTGIGIAPEHLDRVFERFYRVDKERSHQAGGTGLGLAIVKHIVEAHGSRMVVTSTPGHGSTFSFDLKT